MKHLFPMAVAGLFLTAATFAVPAQAEEDYDMDCKVILCLAGGFPSGCGDAKSYMFKRLRKGKAPFGICTFDDGGAYEAVDANVNFLHGQNSYLCDPGKTLFYERDSEGSGATAFCYESKRRIRQGDDYVTIYEGKVQPTYVNMVTQVTVQAGQPDAYTSPRFFINTGNGTVVER